MVLDFFKNGECLIPFLIVTFLVIHRVLPIQFVNEPHVELCLIYIPLTYFLNLEMHPAAIPSSPLFYWLFADRSHETLKFGVSFMATNATGSERCIVSLIN